MLTHPIASLLPEMPADQYTEFRADLAQHGQRQPILVYQGKVLDGRARVKALTELGHKPTTETFTGTEADAWREASRRFQRRQHATAEARVAALLVGAKRYSEVQAVIDGYAAEAKQRKTDALNKGSRKGHMARSEKGRTREAIGRAASGASGRTAARVLRIAQNHPDRLEDIINGKASAHSIEREAAKVNRWATPIEGKYRVWLADPPWHYGGDATANPDKHYRTMSVENICSIPVADHSEPNAVCFLWSPACMLVHALQVLDAWGFTYTTQYVWVKTPAGCPGAWSRVEHEVLLVGKRGSITPAPLDYDSRPSSVLCEEGSTTAPTSKRHSEKPTYYHDMIDVLFPHDGPTIDRAELFARRKRNGWRVFGDEITT